MKRRGHVLGAFASTLSIALVGLAQAGSTYLSYNPSTNILQGVSQSDTSETEWTYCIDWAYIENYPDPVCMQKDIWQTTYSTVARLYWNGSLYAWSSGGSVAGYYVSNPWSGTWTAQGLHYIGTSYMTCYYYYNPWVIPLPTPAGQDCFHLSSSSWLNEETGDSLTL
jgi:hypothetical protein